MLAPRTVVVVNPKSQGGRLASRWTEVAETLGRAFPFDEVITQGPGDATRLTRAALRAGAERVVAIGGDGTINEVVNGFFEDGVAIAPEASLGVIPYGTGGDFRRTLALPTHLEEAAQVIRGNRRRQIDLGKLTYTGAGGAQVTRMFVNIASFGVSGVVDRLVNESGKKLGGKLSFLLASARATWSYTNQRVELVFDGKDRAELTINTVAVANGRYFGGGMHVAPAAELDDGAFDVISLGDLGFRELLTSGRRLYAGTHLSMDKVSSRRARVVEAAPVDPAAIVELDVDGENLGRLPARFELVPAALWTIVP